MPIDISKCIERFKDSPVSKMIFGQLHISGGHHSSFKLSAETETRKPVLAFLRIGILQRLTIACLILQEASVDKTKRIFLVAKTKDLK